MDTSSKGRTGAASRTIGSCRRTGNGSDVGGVYRGARGAAPRGSGARADDEDARDNGEIPVDDGDLEPGLPAIQRSEPGLLAEPHLGDQVPTWLQEFDALARQAAVHGEGVRTGRQGAAGL